jgi:hypothetical protein
LSHNTAPAKEFVSFIATTILKRPSIHPPIHHKAVILHRNIFSKQRTPSSWNCSFVTRNLLERLSEARTEPPDVQVDSLRSRRRRDLLFFGGLKQEEEGEKIERKRDEDEKSVHPSRSYACLVSVRKRRFTPFRLHCSSFGEDRGRNKKRRKKREKKENLDLDVLDVELFDLVATGGRQSP